jgi:hypothetical protein
MFSNPIFNHPSQFNDNLLTQNLAGLSLNLDQPHQKQQQQQQQGQNIDFGSFQFPQEHQQIPIDIGGYVPPTLDETNIKWPSPDDINVSYERGSTVVRQYNNSMIDDYYKKFLRPITDYVSIPTNGQPTYVYQNLAGQQTTTTQQTASGGIERWYKVFSVWKNGDIFWFIGEIPNDSNLTGSANVSQANTEETEEKKHKKKHKKRSSKHHHDESSKHIDSEKVTDER